MRVRPCQTTSHTEQQEQTEVAGDVAGVLRGGVGGSAPPPPKQPQSISMPRAHADEMPMMNATKNSPTPRPRPG